MIGIIADDLSGAAEMAGLTFRYGLDSVICLHPDSGNLENEVIILDTDSRSLTKKEATMIMEKAGNELFKKKPDWIYKKVDSVFRGNIAIELETLSRVIRHKRTLLIPANPSLGRTIRSGDYYIHNRLLDKTDFAADPELAEVTSSVVKLLNPAHADEAVSLKSGDSIAEGKIVIGDACSTDDLVGWAEKIEDDVLPAGGSDFLAAILKKKGFHPTAKTISSEIKWPLPSLLVSGTASLSGRNRIDEAERNGIPVCRMPKELIQPNCDCDEFIVNWQKEVSTNLQKRNLVIATVGLPRTNDLRAPSRIVDHLFALTKRLFEKQKIGHLWIEGGATASRIIRGHGWDFLKAVHEWDRGVVSLTTGKKNTPILTIKPGSYPWPRDIWEGQEIIIS